MKKLLIIPFLLLGIIFSSCETERKILQKNLMSVEAEITYIDNKLGFVSLRWECADPPYINQPCFKYLEFPIQMFNDPQKGKRFIIIEALPDN